MSLLACLLSNPCVQHHELVVWLCNGIDPFHFIYELGFKGVPACSIHDFHVVFFQDFEPFSGDFDSIGIVFFSIESHIELLTEGFKLVVCPRSEGICCYNSCFESFSLEVAGKLCSTCSFSASLKPDHHYNLRLELDLSSLANNSHQFLIYNADYVLPWVHTCRRVFFHCTLFDFLGHSHNKFYIHIGLKQSSLDIFYYFIDRALINSPCADQFLERSL